jgi:hypothetical protein
MRTVKHVAVAALVSAGFFLLPGCSWLPKWGDGWFGLVKKKADAPEATLPTWIGRVVMVDTENRFALVDTGAPVRLPTGQKLLAFRERQRTALLETTGETRPPFLAVQMVEGVPAIDDQVAVDESRPPEALPSD